MTKRDLLAAKRLFLICSENLQLLWKVIPNISRESNCLILFIAESWVDTLVFFLKESLLHFEMLQGMLFSSAQNIYWWTATVYSCGRFLQILIWIVASSMYLVKQTSWLHSSVYFKVVYEYIKKVWATLVRPRRSYERMEYFTVAEISHQLVSLVVKISSPADGLNIVKT